MKIICDILRTGDAFFVYDEYSGHSDRSQDVDSWTFNMTSVGHSGKCRLPFCYNDKEIREDMYLNFVVIKKFTTMIEVEIDISPLSEFMQNELIHYSELFDIYTTMDSIWENGQFAGYIIRELSITKSSTRKRKIRPSNNPRNFVDNIDIDEVNIKDCDNVIDTLKTTIGA